MQVGAYCAKLNSNEEKAMRNSKEESGYLQNVISQRVHT